MTSSKVGTQCHNTSSNIAHLQILITICSEMAGLKVKSHLESLMGTDIIKLNDREYMLSLQSRLMDEYESVMNKQVTVSPHHISVSTYYLDNCVN